MEISGERSLMSEPNWHPIKQHDRWSSSRSKESKYRLIAKPPCGWSLDWRARQREENMGKWMGDIEKRKSLEEGREGLFEWLGHLGTPGTGSPNTFFEMANWAWFHLLLEKYKVPKLWPKIAILIRVWMQAVTQQHTLVRIRNQPRCLEREMKQKATIKSFLVRQERMKFQMPLTSV